MKNILTSLALAGTLVVGGMAVAESPMLTFDDSGFDYTNEDLETAYVNLDYQNGELLVTFSDDEIGSVLPVVDVDGKVNKNWEAEGYNADDNFFYIYGPDFAENLDVVDLDYRGRTFYAVSLTHDNAPVTEVKAAYDNVMANLGFSAVDTSADVTIYERGDEQIRTIFTAKGVTTTVRLTVN